MSVNLNIKVDNNKKERRFLVDLDAEKFERLAASFGFFNARFLKSLDKAEKDIKKGKTKKIKSLKDLVKN